MYASTCRLSVIFVILAGLVEDSHQLECTNPKEPKTRTFYDLRAFQNNRISFNYLTPSSQGNYVDFAVKSIDKLAKNDFVAYDSRYIYSLDLSGKNLSEIEPGSFAQLDCLHVLDLSSNRIGRLAEDSLKWMYSLTSLNLSSNVITDLPSLIFHDFYKLVTLDLSKNLIEDFHPFVFSQLASLQNLNLSSNRLSKIDGGTLFGTLYNLHSLSLSWNRFRVISTVEWSSIRQLSSLDLAGNFLQEYNPSNNSVISYSLEMLNISSNHLSHLDASLLRLNYRKLQVIDLNDNYWVCTDLLAIQRELQKAGIKIIGRSNKNYDQLFSVDCKNSAEDYKTTTSTSTQAPITSSMPITAKTTQSTLFEEQINELLSANKKLVEDNDRILTSLQYLQTFTILMFIIIVIFVILETVVRTNYCRTIFNRGIGGTDQLGYLDNSMSVENFRLLPTS